MASSPSEIKQVDGDIQAKFKGIIGALSNLDGQCEAMIEQFEPYITQLSLPQLAELAASTNEAEVDADYVLVRGLVNFLSDDEIKSLWNEEVEDVKLGSHLAEKVLHSLYSAGREYLRNDILVALLSANRLDILKPLGKLDSIMKAIAIHSLGRLGLGVTPDEQLPLRGVDILVDALLSDRESGSLHKAFQNSPEALQWLQKRYPTE